MTNAFYILHLGTPNIQEYFLFISHFKFDLVVRITFQFKVGGPIFIMDTLEEDFPLPSPLWKCLPQTPNRVNLREYRSGRAFILPWDP